MLAWLMVMRLKARGVLLLGALLLEVLVLEGL
jgi:hypothetical protein